jgi:hypothetical protein
MKINLFIKSCCPIPIGKRAAAFLIAMLVSITMLLVANGYNYRLLVIVYPDAITIINLLCNISVTVGTISKSSQRRALCSMRGSPYFMLLYCLLYAGVFQFRAVDCYAPALPSFVALSFVVLSLPAHSSAGIYAASGVLSPLDVIVSHR